MDKLEFKAALSVDDAGTITGTAWPFGSADRVGDLIQKGAFTSPPILPMLFAHDQAQAIGVWDSITETSEGLTVKGRLLIDDVARAREVRALVREGAVTGLSIGFVTKQAQSRRGGGRTISALDLHEISIVPIPSHPGARIISAKSAISKESKLDKDETAVAPNIAALETKLAEIAGEVKSVTKLNDRLDRIEAKLNRPGIELKADNDNAGLERKAFVSFVRKGREAMDAEEIKSLVVANDVQAGYLAPPELSTEMIRNLVLFSPVRAAASVGATGSSSVILPKRTAITNATWEGEIEESEESDPAFGQLEIPNFGIKTYTDISLQLLEDSVQNIETELTIALAEDFGRKEGVAFLNGTGVKQPRGIMVCPDVGFFPNGDTAAIKSDSLIDLMYSLPPVYRNKGAWMMNGTTIAVGSSRVDLQACKLEYSIVSPK